MIPRLPLTAALLLILPGCAAREMVLPAALAAGTEAVPLTGTQGLPVGTARAGANEGRYRRSFRRVTLLGVDERDSGITRIALNGPDVGRLDVQCRLDGRRLSVPLADDAALERTLRPLSFACDFLDAREAVVGGLVLNEVFELLSGPIARRTRTGTLRLREATYDLVPAYNLKGQDYDHLSPIGYFVERDGRQVAALEMDSSPRLILPTGAGTPDLRRALIAGGLALAVMWDERTIE